MKQALSSSHSGAVASAAPACKAQILDGRALARRLMQELHAAVVTLQRAHGYTPYLALLSVGNEPASLHYLGHKLRQAQRLGMRCELITLPATIAQSELLAYVERLNRRPEVSGILVQLPLPSHLHAATVLAAIAPDKDVDGLHPWNLGKLFSRGEPPLPCLPWAVCELLRQYGIDLEGKRAVILGDEPWVSRALAMLLLHARATVTVCPWEHAAAASLARRAELLIPTGGQPQRVTASWVRTGAVVVDAGMNYVEGRVVGDVDTATVARVAAALAPTPGGVGPLIVTALLHNTLAASCRQLGLPWPLPSAPPQGGP